MALVDTCAKTELFAKTSSDVNKPAKGVMPATKLPLFLAVLFISMLSTK
jgi:hypothetical protein